VRPDSGSLLLTAISSTLVRRSSKPFAASGHPRLWLTHERRRCAEQALGQARPLRWSKRAHHQPSGAAL